MNLSYSGKHKQYALILMLPDAYMFRTMAKMVLNVGKKPRNSPLKCVDVGYYFILQRR
jgi:hypothetical protein